MTLAEATLGMVANFGPLSMADLCSITGWDRKRAYRAIARASRRGFVRASYVGKRRCYVLARPVCVDWAVL